MKFINTTLGHKPNFLYKPDAQPLCQYTCSFIHHGPKYWNSLPENLEQLCCTTPSVKEWKPIYYHWDKLINKWHVLIPILCINSYFVLHYTCVPFFPTMCVITVLLFILPVILVHYFVDIYIHVYIYCFSFLALVDYVSRAHEIAINCPSSVVRPSVRQCRNYLWT